jgi:hypothetical protein
MEITRNGSQPSRKGPADRPACSSAGRWCLPCQCRQNLRTPGPSQDRSAQAAATAATAAIKACESATAACAAGQPSTLEPVSGQAGLRFPGKVILGDRDRAAITSVEAEREKSRDQADPTEGADTGYLAPPQEISAVRRVIGGGTRTRTLDPLD